MPVCSGVSKVNREGPPSITALLSLLWQLMLRIISENKKKYKGLFLMECKLFVLGINS
jgi:hypothetical protein